MELRKQLQFAFVFFLAVTLLLFSIDINVINAISLVFILLFGVPHGALDHKIYFSTSSNKGKAKFFILYTGLIVAYLVWWFFEPISAFVFFLLLSAFHFGQEFLEEHQVQNSLPLNLIWGFLIIIAPLLYNYEEVTPYLEALTKLSLPSLDSRLLIWIPVSNVLLALCSLFYLQAKERIVQAKVIEVLVFVALMLLLHTQLYFVTAFTLYFLFFHSMNAFAHQFQWLKKQDSSYTMKRFVIDLAGFSVIAIIGIVGLLFFIDPTDTVTVTSYFFVLVSVITLPHAVIFDYFYGHK